MSRLTDTMKNSPYFYSGNGASKFEIEEAEQKLKVCFSSDYKEYLQELAYVSFNGHELTGITTDKNQDVVYITEYNRGKTDVSEDLYVIEEAHIDGIVIWQASNGVVYQTMPGSDCRKIADNLLEYILQFEG